MSGRLVLTLRNAAQAAKPVVQTWICKPCGAKFEPPQGLADDEAIRCPACTARLGKAADFANPSPTFARLRARPAPAKPTLAPAVLVTRSKRKTVWTKS